MRFTLVVVLMVLSTGCGKDGAKLHPVRGTVTRAGKPAASGTVQFVHQTEAKVRAVGEIGSDGTFTLNTLGDNGTRSGAAAGSYKVLLVFTPRDPPVRPDTIFVVEPRENTFTIALP